MSEKNKTIQDALAEVQRKINEAQKMTSDSRWLDPSSYDEPASSAGEPKPSAAKPAGPTPTPKPTTGAAKPGILTRVGRMIAKNPKTALAGAAVAAGTAALGSDGIQKVKQFAKDSWNQATTGKGETPIKDAITGSKTETTPAPAATTSRTGVGMNKVMNRSSTTPAPAPTSKPAETAKPVASPKPGAPAKPATPTKPGIVSKADLETYRTNVGNKNATLGQYMNDLQNKTAITGGKNDPAEIQKRLNKTSPGEKAFDPRTSSGNFGDTVKASSAPVPPSSTAPTQKTGETAGLPPKRPTDLPTSTEYESGKKKKMSEDTNPLIAAFFRLQETKSGNMFEAAKKAKKDWDKDGKIESEKDEVWGSRLKAAKEAGKLKEDEQIDEISKKLAGDYIKKSLETTPIQGQDGHNEKRARGVNKAINKLSGYARVNAKEETQIDEISKAAFEQGLKKYGKGPEAHKANAETVPFEDSHKRSHEKSSEHVHRLAVKAMEKQKVKEEVEEIDEEGFLRKTFDSMNPFKKAADAMGPDKPAESKPDMRIMTPAKPVEKKKPKEGSADSPFPNEEVTFSQAEIDHLNRFFNEASVAPNRPEVARGADSTSDKMSQNDVTGTSTESGKKKVKEEIELDEISKDLALKAMKASEKKSEDDYEEDMGGDWQGHENRAKSIRGYMRKKFGNDIPGRGSADNDRLGDDKGYGRIPSDRLTRGPRAGLPSKQHVNQLKTNIKFSLGKHTKPNLPEEVELDEMKASRNVAGVYALRKSLKGPSSTEPSTNLPSQRSVPEPRPDGNLAKIKAKWEGTGSVKEETLEEGRPKKNPEPETMERDPRKHIQVEAGRAAAGNVIDFTHNNGSKSKITPAMGRRIVAHLQGLKPADRQSAVNRMHDSAEGLKV